MSRILVTGGEGRLGSTLVPYLRRCGHDVVSSSRTRVGTSVDLADNSAASAFLTSVSPTVIVNLVALTDVDRCQSEPQEAYLANVRVVENLAAWMACRPECHLIQVSTDHVYDGAGDNRESDVVFRNAYALSKYAGELAAASVSTTIVRTNFFGRSDAPARRTLSDWIVGRLRRGDSVPVFDDIRFSPVSLNTLSTVLEGLTRVRTRGVFNVGSAGGMTKAEFAYALAEALDLPRHLLRPCSYAEAKLATPRPRSMCMDSSRYAQAHGASVPFLRDEIAAVARGYLS